MRICWKDLPRFTGVFSFHEHDLWATIKLKNSQYKVDEPASWPLITIDNIQKSCGMCTGDEQLTRFVAYGQTTMRKDLEMHPSRLRGQSPYCRRWPFNCSETDKRKYQLDMTDREQYAFADYMQQLRQTGLVAVAESTFNGM